MTHYIFIFFDSFRDSIRHDPKSDSLVNSFHCNHSGTHTKATYLQTNEKLRQPETHNCPLFAALISLDVSSTVLLVF